MFENAPALYLLFVLLPVIILYLLKPKPKTIKIPSLLLLLSSDRKRKLRSLFDKIIKDPLLLIQLLALIILVSGIAGPYYERISGYDHTIIVLDASASMSATDVKPDRFSQAVEIARKYIDNSDKISLILVQDVPVLLFDEKERNIVNNRLNELKPRATGTDLNEAIMLAIEMLKNRTSRLVVISDFSGQDISDVQKIVESRNIPVAYHQIGIGGSNLGIVDATFDPGLKFVVRNFDNVPKDTIIKIIDRDSVKTIKRSLKPKSSDFFTVPDINGTATIQIDAADDLSIDNILYISLPGSKKNKRILLLSDSPGKKKPISVAFKSIPGLEIDDFSFERAPRKLDYSMVVLYDYTKSSILPGTMEDIKNYALSGGTVVFEAASDLQYMDSGDLLPVNVSGLANPSLIDVKNSGLTAQLDFGVSGYLKGSIKEGAVELASAKEGPVFAYWNFGKGKVFYVGTNEKWGDFHLQSSYPIFWYNILEFVVPSSGELNFKSGTLLPLGQEKNIKGPARTIRTDKLYLDEVGFYEIEDKTITSNLLDEKESDISLSKINFTDIGKVSSGNLEKIHFQTILALLAILVIGLELYFLKARGDI